MAYYDQPSRTRRTTRATPRSYYDQPSRTQRTAAASRTTRDVIDEIPSTRSKMAAISDPVAGTKELKNLTGAEVAGLQRGEIDPAGFNPSEYVAHDAEKIRNAVFITSGQAVPRPEKRRISESEEQRRYQVAAHERAAEREARFQEHQKAVMQPQKAVMQPRGEAQKRAEAARLREEQAEVNRLAEEARLRGERAEASRLAEAARLRGEQAAAQEREAEERRRQGEAARQAEAERLRRETAATTTQPRDEPKAPVVTQPRDPVRTTSDRLTIDRDEPTFDEDASPQQQTVTMEDVNRVLSGPWNHETVLVLANAYRQGIISEKDLAEKSESFRAYGNIFGKLITSRVGLLEFKGQ